MRALGSCHPIGIDPGSFIWVYDICADVVEIMKLRDHPLLKRSNNYSSCGWLPIWTNTRPDPNDKPQGEIGKLQQVLKRQDLAEILFLVIQYQNRRDMGAMRFDDDAFCQVIYALLQSQSLN